MATQPTESFMKKATPLAAALLAGLPKGVGGDGLRKRCAPETSDVRFGIIALTDCASIVMAHELGYFKTVRHQLGRFRRKPPGRSFETS